MVSTSQNVSTSRNAYRPTPPPLTNWEKKKDEKRGQDFAGIKKVYTVQFSKTATFFKICMEHRKFKNLKR